MTSYDCHMTRLTENRKGKDEDQVYLVRLAPACLIVYHKLGKMPSLVACSLSFHTLIMRTASVPHCYFIITHNSYTPTQTCLSSVILSLYSGKQTQINHSIESGRV